ncbi:MAG TPA: hypothetical protein VJ276_00950 [Thermoanaerobaculia bacterium]|nr:hypothetical protein [Thermoanaerobaculia bacterium]
MLKLREEQLAAFARAREAAFRRQLRAEARRHWPEECALLDEAGLAARIEEAVARAAKHGFTAEMEVARWVNLTMALGPELDVDPRYPWAAAILADEAIATPHKIRRLCALAAESLERRPS